uniref:acidic leucine-rich nuclear phosphoprotein 32 family member A-like n=1 Tax=Erigeron canadensis TaxID=72917 RepID=UPI001CB8FC9C|nr:acidic leucine-rich nuclear phosphoprotein 32 family member A-like [Erigeron canadensis]
MFNFWGRGNTQVPRAESRQPEVNVISSVNNEDNISQQNIDNNVNEVNNEVSEVEKKVEAIDADAIPDQELEGYGHHEDEDYDHEQIDGEYCNLEEGEEYFEEDEEGYETGKKENEVYS